MNLNISQLLALASDAGFQGDDLATAVAVALAESSGNPQAYNPERAAGAAEGMGSFGLWQIYREAHPEFAGENLFDPPTNAAAAFSIYQRAGNSFKPWSTFKAGTYAKNMDAVLGTIQQSQQDTAASSAPDQIDASAADPTTGDSTGGGPSGGEIVGIVIGGVLAFWAISRWL